MSLVTDISFGKQIRSSSDHQNKTTNVNAPYSNRPAHISSTNLSPLHVILQDVCENVQYWYIWSTCKPMLNVFQKFHVFFTLASKASVCVRLWKQRTGRPSHHLLLFQNSLTSSRYNMVLQTGCPHLHLWRI